MILDQLTMDPSDLEQGTGWTIKPEGACRGDVCVPLAPDCRDEDGTVAVVAFARRLGMPLVGDEAHGIWALGPASAPTGRALVTATAPDFELPDIRTGEPFRLSSLRGQKVALIAWASW